MAKTIKKPPARSAKGGASAKSADNGLAAGNLRGLQIGARVRHARILEGIRIKDLAERVGCTEGMISKIERDRVVPSLPMLQRIIDALGRDLAAFFGANPTVPDVVQRAGERSVVSTDPIRHGTGVSYERLVPFGAGNLLEGNIHRVEPGGNKIDNITHQGEALGYLLEGELELTVDGTTYALKAGDSFFFKAYLTNKYRNPGKTVAKVLWVNTPQVH